MISEGLSGTKQGEKMWVAEMYGYIFAAAVSNVWHHMDRYAAHEPGMTDITGAI